MALSYFLATCTFTEHLKELPCYVLRAGRQLQDDQRITITMR